MAALLPRTFGKQPGHVRLSVCQPPHVHGRLTRRNLRAKADPQTASTFLNAPSGVTLGTVYKEYGEPLLKTVVPLCGALFWKLEKDKKELKDRMEEDKKELKSRMEEDKKELKEAVDGVGRQIKDLNEKLVDNMIEVAVLKVLEERRK